MHAFHFGGDFRAAQNETNLWSIAVTDRQIPACFDHIRNVMSGLTQRLLLVFHADALVIFNKGVATDSYYSEFCHMFISPFICLCEAISC
jgi:hypothetical protein